jgi:hypothetical protein
MNGVTTDSSEEPYVNSTSTVLWEVPGATRAAYPIVLGTINRLEVKILSWNP